MTQTPTDAQRLVPVEPTEAMLDAVKPWPEHWPPYGQATVSARAAYDIDRAVLRSNWTHMLAAAPASPLPGVGWQELVDEIMQRAKTCEELITDDGDDFAGGRVSGKAQAYKHSAELIRAFLARNGKGEGQ